ncbi:MAG: hypothetical protein V7K38_06060 [Nostoc sp.]|uniref:hypothetical protein n=1 Tax=Nostoc sp. TaxID=1180 RepID=UPI002FF79344
MVERPIKKSERQSQANTDNNSENTDSITPIESNPKSSKPTRNRSSGTDKKASYGNETRQQGNPALARGPKPVKPPVKVETEELETESETISEESQD